MEFNPHKSFLLNDRSFFSITRKDIHKLAHDYGFSENKCGKIDIILSELTSNLSKHTQNGGELLVKALGEGKPTGIEIICLDHGPGMRDPIRMMEDGTSTVGSQGEGLGAIKRLSDEFDLYSHPGSGTVVLSRLYVKDKKVNPKFPPEKLIVGAVLVPKPGEIACGDACYMRQTQHNYTLLTLDGLGHGPEAQAAVEEAIRVFQQHPNKTPSALLAIIHQSIKKTRGAVGAITLIDPTTLELTFCGIGNMAGKIISFEGSKNLMSYNGILGYNCPATFNDHTFTWNESSVVLLYSDGLKSKWDFLKYPELKKHDPSTIAAVLYKDYARRTDDSLILVGKSKR
jgi:anti-sigma regulatory factor (Ser/Thr protein kinase)